tara:strand:- start:423 stop:1190 length:768 start_codon:yes stop_codon:yes gene_type:complete
MATTKRNSNALSLPDDMVGILAAEDKRKGFPIGTMQSLMAQEIGGQEGKYLKDITAYHYEPNAKGKRIAGHTGKVSTAFGPFGLLESTAKDPGYGVKPLGDRTSFAEQARFSADYLGARGLAGYGEGEAYAQAVENRRDGAQNVPPVPGLMPAQDAQAPAAVVMADAAPVSSAAPPAASAPVPGLMPVAPQAPDAWQEFLIRSRASGVAPPMATQTAAYQPMPLNVPDFMSMVGYMNKDRTPTGFQAFDGMDASI